MTRLLRSGLAAFAVVVAAWFLIGVRQAHDLESATAVLARQPSISKAGGRRVASLLSSADVLYPGIEVILLRARLAMERQDHARAKPLVEHAIAAEPDNIAVWISALDLAIVDPSAMETKQIVARLRALDPIGVRNLIT